MKEVNLRGGSGSFEVTQEFDLEEIFGVDLSNYREVAEVFGQSVIDLIRERTAKTKDIDGDSLPSPYSDSYSESLIFEAYDKSKNKVNMKLTGDMLDDLDIMEIDGNKIVIGFDSPISNAKAYGHITGFEGHPVLDGKVKPREFFGIKTNDDLNKIKKQVRPVLDRIKEEVELEDFLTLSAIDLLDDTSKPLVGFRVEDLFEDE